LQQQRLQNLKPWIRQLTTDQKEQAIKQAKELVYQLIDQPGACFREGIDEIDLEVVAKEDLSRTTPPKPDDKNWIWVDSADKMQQCIQELLDMKPNELAFDVECFNKSKTAQLTCLIQLATDNGREYVIDVLADGVWDLVNQLAPLFAEKSIVKIGHGINGVDTPSLYRDFGIVVVNVFDTLEAARVLRLKQKGLAKVCAHYRLPNCQVYDELKAEYQMTDWTRRPLTEPMVLYGRYDVHYLVQLRRLMIRDLINVSGGVKNRQAIEDAENLQAVIQAMNDEDDIEDDNDVTQVVLHVEDEDSDPFGSLNETNNMPLTIYTAKDLRMNLELMRAISSSQIKCLSLWNDRPGNHHKDAGYLKIVSKAKMEGVEWTSSQLQLYNRLAHWREEVATRHGILPGFVCGLDFLAKVARTRPISKAGMQQIAYHLPYVLLQNNEEYLSKMLVFVHESRAEDNLTDNMAYPSFEGTKASRSKDDGKKWMYLIGMVAAFSATAAMVKGRTR
jgi:ribonuclease D